MLSTFISSNVFAKTEVVYIPKNTGNPYFDSIIKGFEIGAEKYGYNFTSVAPATADATSQLPFIKANYGYGRDQDWSNINIKKTIASFSEIRNLII